MTKSLAAAATPRLNHLVGGAALLLVRREHHPRAIWPTHGRGPSAAYEVMRDREQELSADAPRCAARATQIVPRLPRPPRRPRPVPRPGRADPVSRAGSPRRHLLYGEVDERAVDPGVRLPTRPPGVRRPGRAGRSGSGSAGAPAGIRNGSTSAKPDRGPTPPGPQPEQSRPFMHTFVEIRCPPLSRSGRPLWLRRWTVGRRAGYRDEATE